MMHATYFNAKRILVTGGAGFIGSHLVDALIIHGAQVTVLDNLVTGNIQNLESAWPHITFIQGDITDKQACIEASKDQEIIFHLAAQVSVPDSVVSPALCHATNVTGTFNLLEACRLHAITRFIFSSSAAVYGPYEGICHENSPCNPMSPYGLSKYIGERYCALYTQLYGIQTIALRYFNVYGDRQSPHHPYAGVVAQFRHRLAHDLPITIYGDGSQTRDFVPVSYVVEANMCAAHHVSNNLNARIINVASGKSISLLSMLQHLQEKEFPNYKGTIYFAPARSGDIHHSQADATLLQKMLA